MLAVCGVCLDLEEAGLERVGEGAAAERGRAGNVDGGGRNTGSISGGGTGHEKRQGTRGTAGVDGGVGVNGVWMDGADARVLGAGGVGGGLERAPLAQVGAEEREGGGEGKARRAASESVGDGDGTRCTARVVVCVWVRYVTNKRERGKQEKRTRSKRKHCKALVVLDLDADAALRPLEQVLGSIKWRQGRGSGKRVSGGFWRGRQRGDGF